ncbi:putative MscS family protein YkuT [Sporomusa silvacetica DSM 10669]|uniref:MscS family protein YkuT n=1 Tax=Sporomusa silvacetica DSM 10669 TaxID=1123289 RepID=A0ABZ3IVM5_9FIRM|nr:mechanosensitive ion channel family protein [Sporomusa silvacetica]OZC14947.1 putative MscS family protein YkuT [Sporomusa silvacetica DSM 10669]
MEQLLTSDFWLGMAIKIIRLAVIVIGGSLVLRFTNLLIEQFFIPKPGSKTIYLEEQRARTLSGLLHSVIRYTIYFIVIVMLLQEFKIDTTSIVAGAGIIGLALGVGAQSLIKDFVTGFFIILEDQYGVGDYIVISDMAGTVEEIGFRVTRLRDGNGILHIVPNGSITKVSNYTRGHMQAIVNVPVPYEADIEQVFILLNEVCDTIGQTVPEVIDGPSVLGVVDLKPGEIVIRIIAKTVPLQQVKVETALRRLIKEKFTEAKIPPPQLFNQAGLPEIRVSKAGG